MRKTAFFLLGVLGLFGSLSAGRFEVGLSGGFYAHKWESGAVFGVSPGFRLARGVSLETEFFYYPSGSMYADYDPDGIQHRHRSLSDLGLTILVGPGPSESRRIAPYLAFGGNLFWELGELESDLEGPFLAVGGGLKYRLSARASLCFDGRYFLQLLEDEYPPFKNLWRLTAGVSFRL